MPYAVRYLTPSLVSISGQLAITAAVMSSVDSSMLSSSSLITRNVYQRLLKPAASQEEVCRVLRGAIWGIGLLAMIMALNVQSVFALWTLSSDLVYVLLFPQFVVLFFLRDWSNTYGAVFGFFVGFVVRALCGEPEMGIPVLLRLPQYDNQRGQQFPFRTMCMLISMCTHIGVSMLAAYAFRSGLLEPNKDVWGCFWEISGASTGIMPAVDSPLLVSGGTIAAGSSGNAREQREPSRSDVVIGQQRSNLAAPSLEPSGKGVVPSAPTTPTTPVSELEAEPTSEKSKRSIAGGEGPRAKKAPMALDANPKEAQDPMKTPAYQADDKLRTDKPINRRQSVVSKSSGGSKTRRPSVFGTELSTSTDMPRSRRQSVVSKSSGGSNTRRASVFNAELSTGMPRSRRQSVVSKSSGGSKTKQTGMTAAEPKNGGSGKAEPKSDKPKSTRLSVSSKSSGSDPKTKQTGVADTEPKGSGTRSKQLPAVSDTESLAGVPRTEGTAASADPELAKSNRQVNKRPSATEPDTKSGVRDDQLRDGPDADPKIRAVSTKYVAQQADAAKAPAKSKGHKSDAAGNKDRKTRKKE
ncbi:uncharacterized protein LOC144136786 isoform X1 [Amblyomma americanum]